jgi:hypothetical protein
MAAHATSQGKVERMSALAVFIDLLLWTWIWGAWGTVLAVPMLVIIHHQNPFGRQHESHFIQRFAEDWGSLCKSITNTRGFMPGRRYSREIGHVSRATASWPSSIN